MKLKTSFFNGRVLLKNLTRFAPVWVLFAVAEVLGLMTLNLENPAYTIANDLRYIIGPVGIAHCGYALIVTACLFGDLFDSRLCNGLHAMPMRREGWLLTNLASGFLFALIPALVGGAVAAVVLDSEWWVALVWQGVSLLQYLFFFGVAVFSAMCAGKRIGMVALYGILNFLSMLVSWVADIIFVPLLPGVVLPTERFQVFSPVVSFCGDSYIDYYCDQLLGGFFRGFIMEDCLYLGICAGVGIGLILLGWLLYRVRHLETAGDFISFRPMRFFFLLTYTLGMGTLMYTFAELFFGTYKDYGFLTVGLIIGWFTGWMLLERTVKIFKKKVWIGFATFALLFAGSIGLTLLDPMGVAAYIPNAEKIDNASIYLQHDIFAYTHAVENWDDGWFLRDAEGIARVQQLHSQMLQAGNDSSGETIAVHVRYELENGFSVNREYYIPAQSQTAEELRPYFSDLRSVMATEDWTQIRDNVDYVNVYFYGSEEVKDVTLEDLTQIQELLKALEADAQAGNLAQHSYFHRYQEQVAAIDLNWNVVYNQTDNGEISKPGSRHVAIHEDCVNTVAFLETLP